MQKNKPFVASMTMEATTATIDVAGVIGWDTSALEFNDLVDRAVASGATAITLRINSVGGYCYDGLAMGDKLRTCGLPTTGIVYGTAMSMASYLLQCCDTRTAHASATLMFHQPSATICGTVDELLTEATYLVGMRDRMFELMASRCGSTGAELSAAHATAKYYDAQAALAAGFLDSIEGVDAQPAPAELSPEPEQDPAPAASGRRVFAYDLGLRVAMMAEQETEEEGAPAESPEEDTETPLPAPDEEEETTDPTEPAEPAEEPTEPAEEPSEPAEEPEPVVEEEEEAPAEPEPALTREEVEEIVARRTAAALSSLGVAVNALPGMAATPASVAEPSMSPAELDELPGMVRLRLLREHPTLAARYANR